MADKAQLSPNLATVQTNGTNGASETPMSPTSWIRPIHHRKKTSHSMELDDLFTGPRDMDRHSKWPFFLRMHGSVLPRMILPLLFVGGWATCITIISEKVWKLGVSNLLLTVMGFVVGLALSFRSSSAYERYSEGRRYWAQLVLTSHNLARIIWVNAKEREGELGKEDMLAKLSALNLLVAFAVSLKHKLRFEPGIGYEDLQGLVEYLDTFAKAAEDGIVRSGNKTPWKVAGEYLGVSFAESNPRKLIKRSSKPLGNLPLETLKYLSAYADQIINNGTLSVGIYQTHLINGIASLNEIMIGTERVLNTPLPIAYSIAISQITWVYVLLLPFQLWPSLRYITIPGTIFAAYIILGLAAIGREIENPFGNDVNDLPLDTFCEEIAHDIDVIASAPLPDMSEVFSRAGNMVLYPLSNKGFPDWRSRDERDIRQALLTKTNANLNIRFSSQIARTSSNIHNASTKEVHEDNA